VNGKWGHVTCTDDRPRLSSEFLSCASLAGRGVRSGRPSGDVRYCIGRILGCSPSHFCGMETIETRVMIGAERDNGNKTDDFS
jgi:hypothetical protein